MNKNTKKPSAALRKRTGGECPYVSFENVLKKAISIHTKL